MRARRGAGRSAGRWGARWGRRWGVGVVAVGLALGLVPAAGAVGPAHDRLVSDDPAATTPDVLDGTVLAIASVGSRVYVGGTFTAVAEAGGGATWSQAHLFAFDRTTGRLDPTFRPQLDGDVETLAVAPDGTSLVVGGRFRSVDGVPQRSLAMLTAQGARVPSFRATTGGYVTKLVVRGNRLLVGGRFGTAGGQPRSNLAAFDATTGALDAGFTVGATEGREKTPGQPSNPAVVELDADAAGTRLVVLGNFRQVGGQPRMQIAMIDLTTNTVSPWSTTRFPNGTAFTGQGYQCGAKFDTAMRDVQFSPDGSYFVVATTGGPADLNVVSLCDTVSRWETAGGPGSRETWRNCTGGDTLYSVAVTAAADGTGGAVYVGGHQRWLDNCGGRNAPVAGSFAADGIGAVDARTGKAIRTWNPGRTRGVGAEELVADVRGLYVGSDTEVLGGERHARLGFLPLR